MIDIPKCAHGVPMYGARCDECDANEELHAAELVEVPNRYAGGALIRCRLCRGWHLDLTHRGATEATHGRQSDSRTPVGPERPGDALRAARGILEESFTDEVSRGFVELLDEVAETLADERRTTKRPALKPGLAHARAVVIGIRNAIAGEGSWSSRSDMPPRGHEGAHDRWTVQVDEMSYGGWVVALWDKWSASGFPIRIDGDPYPAPSDHATALSSLDQLIEQAQQARQALAEHRKFGEAGWR